MARIVYPDNFSDEKKLFSNVYTHHLSLKTKSPLIAFLKQHKYDLDTMQAVVEPATVQEALHLSQKRESESSTEKRIANMTLPWKNFLGGVQFLKGFFVGVEREMGEWALTINGKNRVVYPPSFAARAQLVKDFYSKYKSYAPGESPLQVYLDEHPDIIVADDLQAVENALQHEADRADLEGASQLATQQRNALWNPVMVVVHLIGAFLMALYGEDSRKMAAWGYSVVKEVKGGREQVSTINPATWKRISSVVIPSVLENIGKNDLQIKKGIGKNGDWFVLKSGEKMGMVKGFSRITVSNTSTLEIGKIKIMVNK